jgi:hypothetical protein
MKNVLLLILIVKPLLAVLPPTSVFEVRASVGSDNNGGGFDSAKSGTDYSQQNTAQFSGTDLASVSSLVVSSVSHNFVATDVGNFINITAGTGFTTGVYEIVSVSANQATLDRSPGTVGVGGTWAEGGAFISIAKAISVMVLSSQTWVKATASYVLTAQQVMTLNLPSGPANRMTGYTTTRGDNGQATITTATNSINLFNWEAAANWLMSNFIFSSTAGTPGPGWFFSTGTSNNITAVNCKFTGFTAGISGNYSAAYTVEGLTVINSEFTGNTAQGILNTGSTRLVGVYIHNNTGDGYEVGGSDGQQDSLLAIASIFKSNGGKGINTNQSNALALVLDSDAIINNTGDGIGVDYQGSLVMFNTIIDSNGGYGINVFPLLNAAIPAMLVENNNAFWNNTSGAINGFTQNASDLTLTGDAFVSRSTNNFALNNVAGAGAACRGAGFPGVLAIGGIGYVDIGPLQHQSTGGGQVGSAIVQ